MARFATRFLVAGALVVLTAGCSAPGPSAGPSVSPGASAGPSATAGAVTSPSAPPSTPRPTEAAKPSEPPVAVATPEPDPCRYRPDDGPYAVEPLLPDSAVTVVVAELNVREGPCTSATKLWTAEKGRVFIVRGAPYGPFKANGYSWYFVLAAPNSYPFGTLPKLPRNPFPDGTDTTGGWVAANDGEHAFLTPMAPRCPTTVDLENVVGMLGAERLACLEGTFVLEGTFGCGGCGGSGGPVGEPRWLADTFEFLQIRVRWTDEFQYRPIGLHFRPSGPGVPREGSIIRATVHVDDPAAGRCTFAWTIEEPDILEPEVYATSWCRERLVVDSYEVLGRDPDFP